MTRAQRDILAALNAERTNGNFRVRIVKVRVKDDWKPRITSHAVVRYLERVRGIDIASVYADLNTEALRVAIAYGGGYVARPDCTLVIEKGHVVTVLDPTMRPKQRTIALNKRAGLHLV